MKRVLTGMFRFTVCVIVCFLIAVGISRKLFQVPDHQPTLYIGLAVGCLLGIQVFVKALRRSTDAS